MTTIKVLVGSALCALGMAAGSFLIPQAAFAQCAADGWCVVDSHDGFISYIKVVSRSGKYVTAEERLVRKNTNGTTEEILLHRTISDCQNSRYKTIARLMAGEWVGESNQTWEEVPPNTVGAKVLNLACR
jgi:hypothetical protein